MTSHNLLKCPPILRHHVNCVERNFFAHVVTYRDVARNFKGVGPRVVQKVVSSGVGGRTRRCSETVNWRLTTVNFFAFNFCLHLKLDQIESQPQILSLERGGGRCSPSSPLWLRLWLPMCEFLPQLLALTLPPFRYVLLFTHSILLGFSVKFQYQTGVQSSVTYQMPGENALICIGV